MRQNVDTAHLKVELQREWNLQYDAYITIQKAKSIVQALILVK